MNTPTLVFFKWNDVYNYFRIKDFVYFISSPSIQQELLLVKIVFILFTIALFCGVIYFYINSSYIYYNFLQGFGDLSSLQSSGVGEIDKRWKKIMKKTESGSESEWKLAIIEADDFLHQILEDKGYGGETFEELAGSAEKKMLSSYREILEAHTTRNSIVYDPNYALDLEKSRKILSHYETAIKNISKA